jgi:hypothetical protein
MSSNVFDVGSRHVEPARFYGASSPAKMDLPTTLSSEALMDASVRVILA